MTTWNPRANELFLKAMELRSFEERRALLDRDCGADEALRAEVEQLLEASDRAGSFLDRPAVEVGITTVAPRPGDETAAAVGLEAAGSVIGPVQAPAADRRGRHGHGLHGRADPARPAQGRAQGHQAGDGQPPGHRPLRGRAPGAGHDGPRQHRPCPRRRGHRIRPALLRHGAGPRRADHQVLRRQSPHAAAAAGAVRAGLPGDPARPPEGDHPPRHQAVQRHDHALRRQAGRPR